MSKSSLILASSSPRRRELLTALGLRFEVVSADIDESPREGEPPADMVVRLAVEKAAAVRARPTQIVLGADTAVVLDGRVFGKPEDEADGLRMLACLSGRSHDVLSGVALRHGGVTRTALSQSRVEFREIHPDEARRYWQSGEPAGKAGGYAIQGRGGLFVASLAGSYTGVVGLPVFETAGLLREAGIEILPGADRDT